VYHVTLTITFPNPNCNPNPHIYRPTDIVMATSPQNPIQGRLNLGGMTHFAL